MDPAALAESERTEWVHSRFAWIALLRLQGKDAQAAEVFRGCREYCAKWGQTSEWAALKKWGCAHAKDSEPCRKNP